jgi:hypothetical protein
MNDDFEDTTNDIQIDQRYHERHLNEIFNNGYRDAFQSNMENEVYLQDGFNIGYKLMSKIGFLIGQIYSLFEKYKFTNNAELYEDNYDLIKMKNLLNIIENQILNHNWEVIVKKASDLNDDIELNQILSRFKESLEIIKEYLINYNPEGSKSDVISIDLAKLIDEMNMSSNK